MSGVEKAIEKLQQSLKANQAYEGQQIVLTTHSRLRSRKKLTESYQLLEQAAVLQLQQGQVTCGAELAGLLVQGFKKDKVVADDLSLLRIVRVLQAFPGPAAHSTEDPDKVPQLCCKFAMESVRWARQYSLGDLALQQDIAGSPEQQLHNHLARYLWEYYGPSGLGWASLHFAHGSEPFRFAAAVASAAEGAPESELDLFLVRAAMQILGTNSRQCLIFCKEFRQAFNGILQQSGRSLPDTALLHFLGLLQEALSQASLPLVQLLKEEYASTLAVDESLPMLFEQIMSRHFKIAPRGNMGGMLGSMLEMFNGFGQADE